ncbi:MAG TPA: hypothetical protein PKA64_06025 [Myxococcota bacterium]|nr:hypothetical protein [Myxococcota bacterium]
MLFSSVRFAGYRTFPDALAHPDRLSDLQLRPLTLVLGKNGSGKTQILRLVHHLLAVLAARSEDVFPIVGRDGRRFAQDPLDVLHRRSAVAPLDLHLALSAQQRTAQVRVRLRGPAAGEQGLQPVQPPICAVDGHVLPSPAAGLLPADADIFRQTAERLMAASEAIGPTRARLSRSYPPPTPGDWSVPIADDGRGAATRLLADPALLESVRAWFGEHLPPVRLGTSTVFDHVALVDHNAGGMNLTEAAEGVHQVLPVVTLLRDRALHPSETIDTIEQPELHLHDAAHAALADLLLEAAGILRPAPGPTRPPGPCLVVETHSEGLLLRVRRRIAEGAVRPEDVSVVFVELTPAGSALRSLVIDGGGAIAPWPAGVFTERFAEVQAIRRAVTARSVT